MARVVVNHNYAMQTFDYNYTCSTMRGGIKSTDSSLNSVLRTVGNYRTGGIYVHVCLA